MHNQKPCALYSSHGQIKENEMVVTCMAHRGGQRYRAVVVKAEGKRRLRRHMYIRWDKVKMDSKGVGGVAGTL
jgi:hypothetical protein